MRWLRRPSAHRLAPPSQGNYGEKLLLKTVQDFGGHVTPSWRDVKIPALVPQLARTLPGKLRNHRGSGAHGRKPADGPRNNRCWQGILASSAASGHAMRPLLQGTETRP